jgi:hypothetical protein
MIWEYPTDDLMCLCHRCHKQEHAIDEKLKRLISTLSLEGKGRVVGYVSGCFGDNHIPKTLEELIGIVNSMGLKYHDAMFLPSLNGADPENIFLDRKSLFPILSKIEISISVEDV